MASKFAVNYGIPKEFPEVLKAFTREVLRVQPSNINEFAVKYFERKAQGVAEDAGASGGAGMGPAVDVGDVENIVRDLFQRYDEDNSKSLDPREFKTLMTDLQNRMGFPPDEIYRFLAEADQNADGMIEYEEFIPLALQIVQSIYAKKALEAHVDHVEQQAQTLVHGMSRDELTSCVQTMFEEIDVDGTGLLSRTQFVQALQGMELGLTRKELNAIMFQVDEDQDGFVSYREFARFAYDLLQKLTSLRLLETEMEQDQFAQYLADLFKSRDMNLTGSLAIEDMRELLHEASLGLTRMQIHTILSEAPKDEDAPEKVRYVNFIPRATAIIRAMLSFQQAFSAVDDDQEVIQALESAINSLPSPCPMAKLQGCLESCGLSQREVMAVVNAAMHSAKGGMCDPAHVATDAWKIVKSVRVHASAF
jgi:Ca2+-binding EF-hand superfamily protein